AWLPVIASRRLQSGERARTAREVAGGSWLREPDLQHLRRGCDSTVSRSAAQMEMRPDRRGARAWIRGVLCATRHPLSGNQSRSSVRLFPTTTQTARPVHGAAPIRHTHRSGKARAAALPCQRVRAQATTPATIVRIAKCVENE